VTAPARPPRGTRHAGGGASPRPYMNRGPGPAVAGQGWRSPARAGCAPRPAVLDGTTRLIPSPQGNAYVTLNEDEHGRPCEVFVRIGHAGSALMADAEAIGRLVSLALRSGIPAAMVHRQLRGISCERACPSAALGVLSLADAVARAMEAARWADPGPREA
jgi:hypothetical protein